MDFCSDNFIPGNSSGSFLKEILEFDETQNSTLASEDIPLINDHDGYKEFLSSSSIGSDSDDPIQDDTLLQHLFYVDKVCSYYSKENITFQ